MQDYYNMNQTTYYHELTALGATAWVMEVLNIDTMIEVTDPEQAAIRRLKNFFFNGILIIVLIAWLVAGSFIKTLEMPPLLFS